VWLPEGEESEGSGEEMTPVEPAERSGACSVARDLVWPPHTPAGELACCRCRDGDIYRVVLERVETFKGAQPSSHANAHTKIN